MHVTLLFISISFVFQTKERVLYWGPNDIFVTAEIPRLVITALFEQISW
jgi:hypothetical protein